jgi:hypothetical protein
LSRTAGLFAAVFFFSGQNGLVGTAGEKLLASHLEPFHRTARIYATAAENGKIGERQQVSRNRRRTLEIRECGTGGTG